MPDERDDSFLLRWSRRKQAAAKGQPATGDAMESDSAATEAPETEYAAAAPPAPPSGTPEEADGENEPVPPELADINIEALDYDADFTQFLKAGVPEALKRRALRRLWRTNPILANVDGLNDYDDDFTDAALAVDVLKTVYKVGRGYFEDEDETEIDDDLDDGDISEDAVRPDQHDSESDEPPPNVAEEQTVAADEENPDDEPKSST
jgi:hypothetical protein